MPTQKSGIARLLQIAGSRKRLLLVSGTLAILHSLLALVPYILMLHIITALITPPPDVAIINHYLLWAGVMAVASYIMLYFSGLAAHVAAYNILYELRKQMADKLGRLPIGVINQRNSGALKKILADDVERVENFIAHHIPDFVKGIAIPVLTICYLFYMDWRMALVSFVPLLLLAVWLPLNFAGEKRKTVLRQYHISLEEMNGSIVEFVRAMPVMKIFGQTADSFHKYSNSVQYFDTFVKAYMKSSTPPFAVFMSFISNALLPVLALGIYLYFKDGITLPVLLLFLILGVGYIKPLFALSNLGSQLSLINMGVRRLDEILFEQGQESSTDIPVAPEDFSIAFRQVTFSYDQKPVLSNINFIIPPGSITALVGPSGAGKSTVAQLVARFWDVQQGMITIGGVDIKTMRVSQLMEYVSFVFQDNFMFQESIYENIRMGMDKSETAIIQAAKAAQCHLFISRLPQGYQTKFGAAGIHLSGGEQQRIQLARAILKNAPILILDEATAFSDPENEYLIQQAFGYLIQHKTVLVIAHRLSTITDADQILVFNKGHLESEGTHDALLHTSPLYQKMWNAHTRAKEFSI